MFSICFYNSALATDPTISFGYSGGGTACTFAEPCLSSTYSAVITDGDYSDGNVYSKKITWTATANAYSNESG